MASRACDIRKLQVHVEQGRKLHSSFAEYTSRILILTYRSQEAEAVSPRNEMGIEWTRSHDIRHPGRMGRDDSRSQIQARDTVFASGTRSTEMIGHTLPSFLAFSYA